MRTGVCYSSSSSFPYANSIRASVNNLQFPQSDANWIFSLLLFPFIFCCCCIPGCMWTSSSSSPHLVPVGPNYTMYQIFVLFFPLHVSIFRPVSEAVFPLWISCNPPCGWLVQRRLRLYFWPRIRHYTLLCWVIEVM